jgi:flagellar protein FliS
MYNNAAKTYQQANFLTADPMKLVLMCYEGAVGNLKLAVTAYEAKDYETKARALQKAIDIIYELNASLDMEKGGAIAANLRTLYTYMSRILTEADLKKDLGMFNKVIDMLEELESAWKNTASSLAETVSSKAANRSEGAGHLKRQPAGMSAYGRPGSVGAARAWSA